MNNTARAGVFGGTGRRSASEAGQGQPSRGTPGFVPGRVPGATQRGRALSGEGAAGGESARGLPAPALRLRAEAAPSLPRCRPGQGGAGPGRSGRAQPEARPLRAGEARPVPALLPCSGDATLKYFFPLQPGPFFSEL